MKFKSSQKASHPLSKALLLLLLQLLRLFQQLPPPFLRILHGVRRAVRARFVAANVSGAFFGLLGVQHGTDEVGGGLAVT